jgi:hypothetical protein
MALNSPQAPLPKFNPIQKGQVLPPQPPYTVNGDVYNSAQEPALQEIFLQNNGNTAVKVAINNVASDNVFHYVLAAATATDAGDGGYLTIDMTLGVGRVSIWSVATRRVSVTKVVNPNGAQGRY